MTGASQHCEAPTALRHARQQRSNSSQLFGPKKLKTLLEASRLEEKNVDAAEAVSSATSGEPRFVQHLRAVQIMGDKSCPFSVEEAKSLTVSKLKAELIRLDQPIAGLKRKAHFVDALTAIIEGRPVSYPVSSPKIVAVNMAEKRAEAKEGSKISYVDTGGVEAKEDSKVPNSNVTDKAGEQGSNAPDADTTVDNTAADAAASATGSQPKPEHPDESETSRGAEESINAAAPATGSVAEEEITGAGASGILEADPPSGEPERALEPKDDASGDVRAPQVDPALVPSVEEENAAGDVGAGNDEAVQEGGKADDGAEMSAEKLSDEANKSGVGDIHSKPSAEPEEPLRNTGAMDDADNESGTHATASAKVAGVTPPSSRKSRNRTDGVDGIVDDQASSEIREGDSDHAATEELPRKTDAMDVADDESGVHAAVPAKTTGATPPSSRKNRKRTDRVDGIMDDQASLEKRESDNEYVAADEPPRKTEDMDTMGDENGIHAAAPSKARGATPLSSRESRNRTDRVDRIVNDQASSEIREDDSDHAATEELPRETEVMDVAGDESGAHASAPAQAKGATPLSSRKSRNRTDRVDRIVEDRASSEIREGNSDHAATEELPRETEGMDVAGDESGAHASAPAQAKGATPLSSRKNRKRTDRVDEIVDDQTSLEKRESDDEYAAPVAGGGDSDAGTPLQEPRKKRSRKSSSSKKSKKSKKIKRESKSLFMDDVVAAAAEPRGGMGSDTSPEGKASGKGKNDATGGVTTGERAAAEHPTDRDEAEEAVPTFESPTAIANNDEGNSDRGSAGGEEGKNEDDGGAPARVTIRVDNFVRPFTAQQAKKLLEDKAGAPLVEGGFWMDSIKTHCYATFEGLVVADRAVAALQGLQWPSQSFKRLEAKIGDVSAEEAKTLDDAKRANRPGASARPHLKLGPRQAAATAAAAGRAGANGADAEAGSPGMVRGRGSVQAPGATGVKRGTWGANGYTGASAMEQDEGQEDGTIKLDELFRKTIAKPALYWLPLSEEEVGERKRKMKEDGVGPRTTSMPADHVEASSGGGRATGPNGGGGGWGGGGSRRGYGGGGGSFAYRPDYSYGGGGGRRR